MKTISQPLLQKWVRGFKGAEDTDYNRQRLLEDVQLEMEKFFRNETNLVRVQRPLYHFIGNGKKISIYIQIDNEGETEVYDIIAFDKRYLPLSRLYSI